MFMISKGLYIYLSVKINFQPNSGSAQNKLLASSNYAIFGNFSNASKIEQLKKSESS